MACLEIRDLGLIDYEKAYDLQQKAVAQVLAGGTETILLCEHFSVLTLGRMSHQENISLPVKEIEQKGVKIIKVDRGGDVTLHSPGQVVVYPILNLKERGQDLRLYFCKLEEVAIDFLKGFAILSDRIQGRTGVWVQEKKIVSIGIGVRRWVSYHGMAININTDLSLFSMIRPCGLDVTMTSLAECKGRSVKLSLAKTRLRRILREHFC